MLDAPEGTVPFANPIGKVNTAPEQITANITANIRRQVPQFAGGMETTDHIAIVGGGWSLAETLDELRELYFDGVKIVALNGAGRWLYERNIRPSMQIVLDARDTDGNRAFVRDPIPHCRYMLASQCDPSLFSLCEGRDVTIFHAIGDDGDEISTILDAYYGGRWNRVPSAGTVGIVAICLMRMAGFRFQHMFGVDSCYRATGEHHSFAQPMNDGEATGRFWCAGREFTCSGWQAKQAYTFQELVREQGRHLQLNVHGDGLLAHMIRTGAELKETAHGS